MPVENLGILPSSTKLVEISVNCFVYPDCKSLCDNARSS